MIVLFGIFHAWFRLFLDLLRRSFFLDGAEAGPFGYQRPLATYPHSLIANKLRKLLRRHSHIALHMERALATLQITQ